MRYLKSFNGFRNQNTIVVEAVSPYLKKGKSTSKSLIECGLIMEGTDYTTIKLLKESLDLDRLDTILINELYAVYKFGEENLMEEIQFFKNVKNAVSTAVNKVTKSVSKSWTKTVKVFGQVYNSFKDFLANIAEVITDVFKKVKNMFITLWGYISKFGMTLLKELTKFVIEKQKGTLGKIAKILGNEKLPKEVSEIKKDISECKERFKKGQAGRQSEEAKKELEKQAEEYPKADSPAEVVELAVESFDFDSKKNFASVFYMLKGYLMSGGSLDGTLKVIREAQEEGQGEDEEEDDVEKEEYKVGDMVKYKTEDGKKNRATIVKIEDNKYFLKDSEGNEFSKSEDDIIEKFTPFYIKAVGFLVEIFKFIMKPFDYLIKKIAESGVNGILKGVSAFARRSWGSCYKYAHMGVVVATIVILLNKMISGGGQSQEEGQTAQKSQGQSQKSTQGQGQTQKSTQGQGQTQKIAQPKSDVSKTIGTGGLIDRGNQFVDENVGIIKTIKDGTEQGHKILKSCEKNAKLENLCNGALSQLTPVLGQTLMMAAEAFLGPVFTFIKYFLMAVGAVNLVQSLCKLGLVKGKICSLVSYVTL